MCRITRSCPHTMTSSLFRAFSSSISRSAISRPLTIFSINWRCSVLDIVYNGLKYFILFNNCFLSLPTLQQFMDTFQHQTSSLNYHRIRIERRKTTCYFICIHKFCALQNLWQYSVRSSCLPSPIGSAYDIKVLIIHSGCKNTTILRNGQILLKKSALFHFTSNLHFASASLSLRKKCRLFPSSLFLLTSSINWNHPLIYTIAHHFILNVTFSSRLAGRMA